MEHLSRDGTRGSHGPGGEAVRQRGCSKAGSGRLGTCGKEGAGDGRQAGGGGEHGTGPQVVSRGASAMGGGAGAHVASGRGRWCAGEGCELGVLQGAVSIHRTCEVSLGGRHGPDGGLGLGDPTHTQFNCALCL